MNIQNKTAFLLPIALTLLTAVGLSMTGMMHWHLDRMRQDRWQRQEWEARAALHYGLQEIIARLSYAAETAPIEPTLSLLANAHKAQFPAAVMFSGTTASDSPQWIPVPGSEGKARIRYAAEDLSLLPETVQPAISLAINPLTGKYRTNLTTPATPLAAYPHFTHIRAHAEYPSQPIPIEVRLHAGIYASQSGRTSGLLPVRLRYYFTIQFWNPYPESVAFPHYERGQINRAYRIRFINAPLITLHNRTRGITSQPIALDLATDQSRWDMHGIASWIDLSQFPTTETNAPGLSAGTTYTHHEPNPLQHPDGLSRLLLNSFPASSGDVIEVHWHPHPDGLGILIESISADPADPSSPAIWRWSNLADQPFTESSFGRRGFIIGDTSSDFRFEDTTRHYRLSLNSTTWDTDFPHIDPRTEHWNLTNGYLANTEKQIKGTELFDSGWSSTPQFHPVAPPRWQLPMPDPAPADSWNDLSSLQVAAAPAWSGLGWPEAIHWQPALAEYWFAATHNGTYWQPAKWLVPLNKNTQPELAYDSDAAHHFGWLNALNIHSTSTAAWEGIFSREYPHPATFRPFIHSLIAKIHTAPPSSHPADPHMLRLWQQSWLASGSQHHLPDLNPVGVFLRILPHLVTRGDTFRLHIFAEATDPSATLPSRRAAATAILQRTPNPSGQTASTWKLNFWQLSSDP